jgi:hypothetical protein
MSALPISSPLVFALLFAVAGHALGPVGLSTWSGPSALPRHGSAWKYAMHDAGLPHVSVGHALLIWVTEWPQEDQTQTKFRR